MTALVIAIGFTLVAGALAVAALELWSRATYFANGAPGRFILWFSLLLSLTIATAACLLSASAWTQGAPTIAVPTVAPQRQIKMDTVVRAIRAPAMKRPIAVAAARPHQRIDVVAAIGYLWLLGFTFCALRIVIGVLRLRSIRSAAHHYDVRSSSRGDVSILISEVFSVPVAVGYVRPCVLLPRAILSEGEIDLESIVSHELEHLARFDDVTGLVQNICLSALWFNPLAHFISQRINAEREMACDEAAARVSGRKTYVDTLWRMALSVSDALVPALASAFSAASTRTRLENLLKRKDGAPRYHADDIFALGAVTVVAFLLAAVIAPAAFLSPAHIEGETVTALQDGNILVTGGMTASGATAAAEVYDVQRHTFQQVGSMHAARSGHTATLLPNGTVLIAGGERAVGRYVATTEIYDPKTRQFTRTVDGEGRVGQTAMVIDDGDVLMFGGANSLNRNCVFIYDTKKASYHDAGTLVAASSHTLTFKLPNGKIVTHSV